jgi:Arc/MetJ-type ribon-helix-helix transcriptional regulator
MSTMKLSVSLPDEDVAFLDEYAQAIGERSRSAVIQRAVRLLRATELGPAYAQAWNEWEAGEDAAAWDSATIDGLEPVSERSPERLAPPQEKPGASR